MTNRDRLAALLDDHRHDISAVTDWRCVCGWINSDGSLSDWNLHLADALIAAGVTLPAPPAVCGASVVIAGVEYVCDREPHTEPVHECTDGIGVMQWRDSDDGPVVVRAWTHDGSDGWPIRG